MQLNELIKILIDCFKRGNFVYACGNGGSAAMSSHFCAELMGKFKHMRKPLPAIALTTDTAFLTAWSNDMELGFEGIFARQIQALGKKDDVLVAFSTSGKSINVLYAIEEAKDKGMIVVDMPRIGKDTAERQENQLKMMHQICRAIEKEFT